MNRKPIELLPFLLSKKILIESNLKKKGDDGEIDLEMTDPILKIDDDYLNESRIRFEREKKTEVI